MLRCKNLILLVHILGVKNFKSKAKGYYFTYSPRPQTNKVQLIITVTERYYGKVDVNQHFENVSIVKVEILFGSSFANKLFYFRSNFGLLAIQGGTSLLL